MTWMFNSSKNEDHAVRLKELLSDEKTYPVPGVFNPLIALEARDVGFKALYFSGAAFSASLGIPDIGLFTLDELIQSVRWIVRSSGLPLIVDADTGFGGAINVVRAVRELEQVGAAAIQIEDQVLPKRCGHLDGKTVVSSDEFIGKIRAAALVRKNLLIVARTDSRATHGMDEAIKRGKLAREAGADIIFPEAMHSKDEFREYADAVGPPLLANMTEFGKSPYLNIGECKDLGYGLVIFPVTTLRVAAKAAHDLLKDIMTKGTQIDWLDKMQTREELYRVIEYESYNEIDKELSDYQKTHNARRP